MCPRRSRPAARPGLVRARPKKCTGHVLYVCKMGEGREEKIEETTEEELQGLDEEGRVVSSPPNPDFSFLDFRLSFVEFDPIGASFLESHMLDLVHDHRDQRDERGGAAMDEGGGCNQNPKP